MLECGLDQRSNQTVAEVYSFSKIPLAAVHGKIKKGRVIRVGRGPRRARFVLKPYPIEPEFSAKTKDGVTVKGKCLIKYEFNASYPVSLTSSCKKKAQLEEELAKEITYAITPLIAEYESAELLGRSVRQTLEAEIRRQMQATFDHEGIRPYKIATYWQVERRPESWLDVKKDKYTQGDALREKADKAAASIMTARGYDKKTLRDALTEAIFLYFTRLLENPKENSGKRLTETVSKAEFEDLLARAEEQELEALCGGV